MNQKWAMKIADRCFWPYVEKTDYCWLFRKNRSGADGNERGNVRYIGKSGFRRILAHRFSYILHFGKIADKILHKCDNTICVNPEHLFEGSQADNMKDMVLKNRSSHGEKRSIKLTEKQVHKIRVLYANGNISHRRLAAQFKVGHSTIRGIVTGETWRRSYELFNKSSSAISTSSNLQGHAFESFTAFSPAESIDDKEKEI